MRDDIARTRARSSSEACGILARDRIAWRYRDRPSTTAIDEIYRRYSTITRQLRSVLKSNVIAFRTIQNFSFDRFKTPRLDEQTAGT
jgi:hypothetical protein